MYLKQTYVIWEKELYNCMFGLYKNIFEIFSKMNSQVVVGGWLLYKK